MVHDIDPKEKIDLFILEPEKGIYFLQSTEIEATGVCSALLVAGRDSTKFCVPHFSFLITRLIGLSSDGILVARAASIGCSVDQASRSMTKKLVAGHMDLVASCSVFAQKLRLLLCGKLDRIDCVASH